MDTLADEQLESDGAPVFDGDADDDDDPYICDAETDPETEPPLLALAPSLLWAVMLDDTQPLPVAVRVALILPEDEPTALPLSCALTLTLSL